jgi:hypothetical protein
MVGIDDVVAQLELDVLDLAGRLELLDQLIFDCLGNGVLLEVYGRPEGRPEIQVCK